MRKPIMKYKKAAIILIATFVGVPVVVHSSFKIYLNDFWSAIWSAGDALSYYGTIISSLITAYLAYVAVDISKKANQISERLVSLEKMDKQVFLRLDLDKSKIEKVSNAENQICIELCFENLTDNLITSFDVNGSEHLLKPINWPHNQKSNNGGVVVTRYKSASTTGFISDGKNICCSLFLDTYDCQFIALSIETVCTSIYGLTTSQDFTILMTDTVFNGYETAAHSTK